ncbi:SOD [Choristoneura occidentalis granulovirus]|uniref:superoxide dismutase n=2 Tax=Betabaculovirus chofumiferanae TaxID=3051997 RepID=Q8V9Y1_GVCF|nr:SOD [Choristoneura fumiferana granulovirus]AAL32266.1 superoxide dismutase [Choristoneura fumiferana granulovirus]AAN77199.1 SOD [Choristoneura fumiferana granulovirus]ABC61178.1 SOD [Choristoneura fumiferana granulovirus]
MKAICLINGDVKGVVEFVQEKPDMPVRIMGSLSNLSQGFHGFHIHEYGDVSNGCVSAGEHLNPFHTTHGGPLSDTRHLGDLGNIYSKGLNVITRFEIVDNMISLYGKYNVLGRSLVIHAMEDDYGRGDNELSKITGNSGSRLGCGVIGVKYEKEVSFKGGI